MPKTDFENKFEERYKKLNPDQKKAVDTIEGPVLVVAGPGTGKTTILTLRIAQILRKTQTSPYSILAITYTNAGVKAMREKLREIIGNTAHDVYIHTFHSFASAMMSEYPDHFVRLTNFKQITDVEQESLIRNILTIPDFQILRPFGNPDVYLGQIIRTISDAKKDALTPDMVREYSSKKIEEVENDQSNISDRGISKGQLKATAKDDIAKLQKTLLFADVYERYEETKQKNKLRDYDDLIIELLLTLKNDELLLRLIQERFQYILVDEHQDTNDAQNFIVGMIAEFFETPNIFVVGDEKQAIYRFQGASVLNFLRFQKLWPDIKVISLGTNYRSHQAILDASFKMIENNYKDDEHKDLRIELTSGSEYKKQPIDIVSAENNQAQEEYFVREIKKITVKEPNASVAIITRRNRELERVLRLLESNDIAVSSERSIDIFHHPVGSAFFDLITYLSDFSRIDALSRTISVGMWGLAFGQSIELARMVKGRLKDIGDHLPGLSRIRKLLFKNGALGGIIGIGEESGFTALLTRDPSFVAVWRRIVTLAESIARDEDLDNPHELMLRMLEYRESAESKPVKVSVGTPDLPIRAMTAHGSKGLEFDYVFIPYANDEIWVGRSWGSSFSLPQKNQSRNDVSDIRRLFYVAITRARKHVSICYALEESDGKTLTPLRFLSELDDKSTKITKLLRSQISVDPKNKKLEIIEHDDLLTHEAKKVLLENGLSVTALNHFIECPSKFIYESVLKLPQAPSITAEKGSAMHEAISKIWSTSKRTEKVIEKIISETATEYIDKSLLSLKEKEAVKKDIITSAPVVAKGLASHFRRSDNVSVERWMENPFDTEFQGKKIAIGLHGKLDAILESVDSVDVYDYKTRKGMSVAAIKGETKNDDGNYFRQLVFYKLLLENDSKFRKKKISTSLVFLTPDDYGRTPTITLAVSDADVKKVKEEIKNLIDDVWSGRISENYCGEKDCQYCGMRQLIKKI